MAGQVCLFGVDRDHVHVGLLEQSIQLASTRVAHPRFDHDRRLDQIGGGQQPHRIGLDRKPESGCFRLVQQDCEERRSIEHHQRGTPR